MTNPFRNDSYPDLTAAIRGVISESNTLNKPERLNINRLRKLQKQYSSLKTSNASREKQRDIKRKIRGLFRSRGTGVAVSECADSVHEAHGTHYALLGKQAVSYETAKEYALWGTKKGETDPFHAQVLLAGPVTSRTPADLAKVRKVAARDGWHDFRVQYFTPGVGAGARDITQAFTQGVQVQGGWERAEAAAAARLRGRNKRKRK